MTEPKRLMETWATTLDNHFDPFENPEAWKRFDEDNGYHTTALICRYLYTADDVSDETYYADLEEAVDKVVRYNFTGNYRKVQKPVRNG